MIQRMFRSRLLRSSGSSAVISAERKNLSDFDNQFFERLNFERCRAALAGLSR